MERDSVSGIGGPSSGGPTHLAPSAPIGSVTLRPLSWPLGTPKGPESGEGQSHTSASKGPADDDSRDDDGADGEKEEWVTWTKPFHRSSALRPLHTATRLALTTTLRGAVPPIFSDGETEAERGALTCLRSHSLAAEPGAAETGGE